MDFLSAKPFLTLLLPPFDLLLLAAVGLLLSAFRFRAGISVSALALTAAAVLCTPAVATTLAGLIEGSPRADAPHTAQAIVILGGGSYAAAPEYGRDTVAAATLERLRWGARMQRATGLPVMVSGGAPHATRTSEAEQMKEALNRDFGIEVKWLEDKSRSTFESARYARAMLVREKIDHVLLVTHAMHMPRARLVFERAGFMVTAAATGYSTMRPPGIANYLPSVQALLVSYGFAYEAAGLGWYHLRLATGG
ncbi:MAG TPA: YdcF family protein [Burkholderiales bacterium]|nr:YdcF family protein [Burkholderiales bacterium]